MISRDIWRINRGLSHQKVAWRRQESDNLNGNHRIDFRDKNDPRNPNNPRANLPFP